MTLPAALAPLADGLTDRLTSAGAVVWDYADYDMATAPEDHREQDVCAPADATDLHPLLISEWFLLADPHGEVDTLTCQHASTPRHEVVAALAAALDPTTPRQAGFAEALAWAVTRQVTVSELAAGIVKHLTTEGTTIGVISHGADPATAYLLTDGESVRVRRFTQTEAYAVLGVAAAEEQPRRPRTRTA